MERKHVVQSLADAIYEGFVKPDGGSYLSRTGTTISQPSLRVHKTRKAFGGLRKAVEKNQKGRFWTKAFFREAIGLMMKQRCLEVPRTAGFSWQEWLKQQVSSFQDLSQKARKNHWRVMSDDAPTLPMFEEPYHTCCRATNLVAFDQWFPYMTFNTTKHTYHDHPCKHLIENLFGDLLQTCSA